MDLDYLCIHVEVMLLRDSQKKKKDFIVLCVILSPIQTELNLWLYAFESI